MSQDNSLESPERMSPRGIMPSHQNLEPTCNSRGTSPETGMLTGLQSVQTRVWQVDLDALPPRTPPSMGQEAAGSHLFPRLHECGAAGQPLSSPGQDTVLDQRSLPVCVWRKGGGSQVNCTRSPPHGLFVLEQTYSGQLASHCHSQELPSESLGCGACAHLLRLLPPP